jgi:hypothetical protein
MEPMKLSFGVLMAYLNRAILQIQDPRKASNGNKYTLKDALLGAFSMFFMQSESFLEYQRQMESHHGKSNAQSLFGMINIQQCHKFAILLMGFQQQVYHRCLLACIKL